METIRDRLGRICCIGDSNTGFIENKYKGQEATTYAHVGIRNVLQRFAVLYENSFQIGSRT